MPNHSLHPVHECVQLVSCFAVVKPEFVRIIDFGDIQSNACVLFGIVWHFLDEFRSMRWNVQVNWPEHLMILWGRNVHEFNRKSQEKYYYLMATNIDDRTHHTNLRRRCTSFPLQDFALRYVTNIGGRIGSDSLWLHCVCVCWRRLLADIA